MLHKIIHLNLLSVVKIKFLKIIWLKSLKIQNHGENN
jgi:hypothetical protein